MRKFVVLTLVVLLALAPVASAQAKPKNPPVMASVLSPSLSWFGTYGYTGYGTLRSGYVYAAEMNYPLQAIGYYTISGQAFVGQASSVTHISGSCFTGSDVLQRFSAIIYIDGVYALPLFDTHDPVAPFDVTVQGQSFTIKINTVSPLGCNFLFESQ